MGKPRRISFRPRAAAAPALQLSHTREAVVKVTFEAWDENMQGAGVLRCLLRVSPRKQPQEGQADHSQVLLHHERSGAQAPAPRKGTQR